jgi:hypothetical protein
VTLDRKGFILTSEAADYNDVYNSIPMSSLRIMLRESIEYGFHFLALINSCYSGDFVRQAFGGVGPIEFQNPGAHAVLAAGQDEEAWANGAVGSGSVFFEKIFAALNGGAGHNGIVTVDDLGAYLRREVQIATNNQQHPIVTDLGPSGSRGGFFFFNRKVLPGVLALPKIESLK